MENKFFIFLIGISGSGKSFYLKNRFLSDFPEVETLLKEKNINLSELIVCPDNIRKEVTGNTSDHGKEVVVWSLVGQRLKEKIEKYNYVILDATNLSERGKTSKGIKAIKIAIIFPALPGLSKERIANDINEGIDRSHVPEHAIEKQYLKFKRSIIGNEHWDGIWNEPVKKKIRENLKREFDKIIIL